MKPKMDERYSDQEATRRVEAALRAAFNAPHKTYEESKVGKRTRPSTKKIKRRRGA